MEGCDTDSPTHSFSWLQSRHRTDGGSVPGHVRTCGAGVGAGTAVRADGGGGGPCGEGPERGGGRASAQPARSSHALLAHVHAPRHVTRAGSATSRDLSLTLQVNSIISVRAIWIT